MHSVIEFSAGVFETVREDREFIFSRGKLDGGGLPMLLVVPCPESSLPAGRALLRQACALRNELDPSWAARPFELIEVQGQIALLIEDPGGEFLDRLLNPPLSVVTTIFS